MSSYLPSEVTSSKEGTEKEPAHHINAYLAVLIITIFGAFMTMLIVRISYLNTTIIVHGDNSIIYTYSPVTLPVWW